MMERGHFGTLEMLTKNGLEILHIQAAVDLSALMEHPANAFGCGKHGLKASIKMNMERSTLKPTIQKNQNTYKAETSRGYYYILGNHQDLCPAGRPESRLK